MVLELRNISEKVCLANKVVFHNSFMIRLTY
jgi:hypothetical protein